MSINLVYGDVNTQGRFIIEKSSPLSHELFPMTSAEFRCKCRQLYGVDNFIILSEGDGDTNIEDHVYIVYDDNHLVSIINEDRLLQLSDFDGIQEVLFSVMLYDVWIRDGIAILVSADVNSLSDGTSTTICRRPEIKQYLNMSGFNNVLYATYSFFAHARYICWKELLTSKDKNVNGYPIRIHIMYFDDMCNTPTYWCGSREEIVKVDSIIIGAVMKNSYAAIGLGIKVSRELICNYDRRCKYLDNLAVTVVEDWYKNRG